MVFPPVPVANYAALLAGQAVAARVSRFAPLTAQSGGETWFDGSGAFVLTDERAWTTVWNRHIQNETIGNAGRVGNLNPAPAVDFDKAIVVALFAGPTRGVVGYRALGGYVLGTQATLRLVPVVDASSRTAIAVPRPWAFLVLPRSKATVSVQMPQGESWNTILKISPTQ